MYRGIHFHVEKVIRNNPEASDMAITFSVSHPLRSRKLVAVVIGFSIISTLLRLCKQCFLIEIIGSP